LLDAVAEDRLGIVAATETPGDLGDLQTIVADREGAIAHWGGECARTLGYSSEEALGQTVALIIPPVLQERHWQGFSKAVSTGQLKRPGKTLKVPAIHKSGAVLAVEGKVALEKGDDGTVETVTLTLHGEGPGWAPPVWRAVLAVLGAAQAVGERLRPASRSR
jgi:PAS domain S-box-containing protein